MGGKSRKLFGFGYFLLPAVLKVLYVLCTIAIFAGGVYLIVTMYSGITLETRILYIVVVALSPFLVRFVFEILLLPFRIAEDLRAIRIRNEQPPKAPEPEPRRNRAQEPVLAPAPAPTPSPAVSASNPQPPQQPPRPTQTVQTPRIQPMPAPKPAEVQPSSLEGDRVAQALRPNDPFSAPPVQRTDRGQ